jgi:hypothetical protein
MGSGGNASAAVTLDAKATALSLTNTFSPNAVTIPTSEGAVEGGAEFWLFPGGGYVESGYGYGPTKVLAVSICLTGQVSAQDCSQQPAITGPLSPAMLAAIDARFAAFARTGVRLVLRCIYNFGPTENGRDAPIDVIATHIDQLAPILLKNRDLIFALEAGFIGAYGEWHNSSNGNDSVAAHKVVLDKELSYFKGVFPVLVRYPAAIIQYAGSATPQDGLGIHDDFYASSNNDGGTWNPFPGIGEAANYTADQLMAYGEQLSANSVFTGGFGDLYPPLQNCAALDAYSQRMHVQAIFFPLLGSVGPSLEGAGCVTSFLSKVGTRIEIQRATVLGNPTPGGTLHVDLTVMNAGYGRVIRARPVTLMFVANGSVVAQLPVSLSDLDLRLLASAATPAPRRFEFDVTLPPTFPTFGTVSEALLIPDPATSLSSQPSYALPLNSLDESGRPVFDQTTGFNVLGSFTAGATRASQALPLLWSNRPSSPSDLSGSWTGRLSVPSPATVGGTLVKQLATLAAAPQVSWNLSQSGTSVRGSVSVTSSVWGVSPITGTISGTLVNGRLTYTVAVPAGTIPTEPACSGQVTGSATVTSSSLEGTAWNQTLPCVTSGSTVDFTLTRQ